MGKAGEKHEQIQFLVSADLPSGFFEPLGLSFVFYLRLLLFAWLITELAKQPPEPRRSKKSWRLNAST
jgi:hypothetical protein